MFGNRCEECGEVRWSIFDRGESKPATCPACGAQMTVERRHPGSHADKRVTERRDSEPAVPPVTTA